jgi:hypothetical protein
MISVEDFLWYTDAAVDGMAAIVTELGDDLANKTPNLPGANSPYALLTHCLGVMGYWGGKVIAGREVNRDRPAEFIATGRVDDLVARSRSAKVQLLRDLTGFHGHAVPRGPVPEKDAATPLGRTQGGVLVHIYEELAQHRGQMEITRDLLLAAG